jgi:excisionase family DNA binding protein
MQRLLTLEEVAKELRINKRTLYLWIKQNRIKAARLPNGQLRIASSELERVLRESNVDPKVFHNMMFRQTEREP